MNIQTSLSIEFIKLKRPGNFVILGLLLLFLFLMSFVTFKMSATEAGRSVYESVFNGAATQALGLVRFFITLFIMMNVGKEFTERTLRKNLIDGVSRDEFFLSKVVLLIVASLFTFVLMELFFLIQGSFGVHFAETIALFTPSFLITSFLKIFLAGLFGFFLIWATRSLSSSIVIYLFWGIAESIIIKLQQVIEEINVGLENYLPLSSIEKLFSLKEQVQATAFIVPVIYIFLMLFIPYYLLMKRDIK